MPLLQTPQFNATKYYTLQIEQPGSGGINLNDLEYEQEINQSPKLLNMMYRNGTFCKRYGQEYAMEFTDTVYDIGYYKDSLMIHAGTKMYQGNEVVFEGLPEKRGLFINFNRLLYYLNDGYYQFDGDEWKEVEPYIPELVINRKPDGSYSDAIENYNRVGSGFKNIFHGDGTSKEYILTDKNLDDKTPICEVDGENVTAFTFDRVNGKVTFTTAPVKGTNNVVITAYKTEQDYIDTILNNKYYATYGGNNNSRLFLAGGGESIYYYSAVFDATYFPESNNATLGNGEKDITGFGEQYDVLMVFKPTEIYSLEYYVDDEGIGQFQSKLVNAKMGCDVPDSIQLINNLLVWCSTVDGICTLVSTNIEDERNVRVISRNIEGGFRTQGILQESNLDKAQSVDWDSKYILAVNGRAYVWDYFVSPYTNTGKLDSDAKKLSWFLFDNWNVDMFAKAGNNMYYSSDKKIVTTNSSYNDFGEAIHAEYQTPFLQFDAVEYLKNVKEMYVQCRADTATVINVRYCSNDNPTGEDEKEPIVINFGCFWDNFKWNDFRWSITNYANVFRRKCSIKKIQMLYVNFFNDEINKDMAISHITFRYNLVKTVK